MSAQRLSGLLDSNYDKTMREMVSRILKDLAEGGYIAIAGRRITITRTLPRAW